MLWREPDLCALNQALPAIDTSIVLATCSRAHLLRGALESLLAEAAAWRAPVELVIVDDGSTDDTPALLAELQRTSPVAFTVLAGERKGIAAARNLAAEHACGVWLASFDDDQVALPGWLAALRELADRTSAPCVSGALELSLPAGHSLDEFGPRARRVLGEHLHGEVPRLKVLPASNNVLIRRDVFFAMGGYDPSFTEGAEDADLFTRMARAGNAIWYQPAARALHITPEARLQQSNLRWTSLRLGASDARRLARIGASSLLGTAVFRAGVSLLRDVPQAVWASVSRNERLMQDVRCSLWYTSGLLRALPAFLGSSVNNSAFLHSLNFRARNGERRETTRDRE